MIAVSYLNCFSNLTAFSPSQSLLHMTRPVLSPLHYGAFLFFALNTFIESNLIILLPLLKHFKVPHCNQEKIHNFIGKCATFPIPLPLHNVWMISCHFHCHAQFLNHKTPSVPKHSVIYLCFYMNC